MGIKDAVKPVIKGIFGKGTGGNDDYGTDSSFPGPGWVVGTVNGTGGAEVAADRVQTILRQAGYEGPTNYGKIVSDVESAVKSGMRPDLAIGKVIGDLRASSPEIRKAFDTAAAKRGNISLEAQEQASMRVKAIIEEKGLNPNAPATRELANGIARNIDMGLSPDEAQALAERDHLEDASGEKQPPAPPPQEGNGMPPWKPDDGDYHPPQEGAIQPFGKDKSVAGGDAPQGPELQLSSDPRAAAIVEMARSPLADPGEAALVKPVESWTESEMKDALNHAQAGFKGWRTGDPQKALAYERVQDWHTLMYGDGEQQFDGGKPVDPKALVAIPKQTAPPRTIDGQDLYQASGAIGQKVAAAAGTDGLDDAVKGLQRGLNMLGQQPMPARSPAWAPYTKQAPLAEDGAYGPKTDFALKQAIGRLGTAKVDDALALGRFNTFARQAQSTGNVDGLEQKTHAVFGPLFRAPNDAKAPKVEGGVFQETLNQIGGQRHDDWTPLKVDNWIGPKTTAAFGRLLQDEDADSITSAFGRGLGLL